MLEHSYFCTACAIFILVVFASKLLWEKELKKEIKRKRGKPLETSPAAQPAPPTRPKSLSAQQQARARSAVLSLLP